MFIDHASPSSITTYHACQWMYYLRYVLQAGQVTGKAALEGKVVHGVIEAVAKAKANGGIVDVDEALDSVWQREVESDPNTKLRRETTHGTSADFTRIRDTINVVLTDRKFSPLHSAIVDVEQHFELMFESPEWQVAGRDGTKQPFMVNGVMDFVREIDAETIEVIDWKTGKREDFWSDKKGKKGVAELMEDVQLRIYHLAATYLYPDYKNVFLTIYFIRDGGPITIPFSQDDITATVSYLWDFRNAVIQNRLITRTQSWRCKRLCSYGRNGFCEAMWGEKMANIHDPQYLPLNYTGLKPEDQERILGRSQSPDAEES